VRDNDSDLPSFDVSPRRIQPARAEQVVHFLAEEEHLRLAAIVESSEDAIISKTPDGIITSWNKGAQRIYGYSAEEALGQPISMLVPSERRRLARDLHDGVLQDLSYSTAAMGLIMLEAEGTGLEEELQSAIDAARGAAQGLRAAVNDLRLEDGRDRPFTDVVKSLVQRNRAMARGCEISLKVGERFPSAPLGDAGTEVLRVIQEALTNSRRHSGARNVCVSLQVEGGELVAEVSDDGRGFRPDTASGVGLNSMSERAAAIGGNVEIESAVGQGTRVHLRVPVPQRG
jgi:PAS domain S-box-containing protein